MVVVEFVIWNDTRRRFLDAGERHWDALTMGAAAVFTDARRAEDVRERETSGTDTTFVLGWLQ